MGHIAKLRKQFNSINTHNYNNVNWEKKKTIIYSMSIEWFFIWTNLNSLHPRMLCAKFSWNCPSGSEEEDEKVKTTTTTTHRQRRRTTDKFWSEKLTWAFGSGELKNSVMNAVIPTGNIYVYINGWFYFWSCSRCIYLKFQLKKVLKCLIKKYNEFKTSMLDAWKVIDKF